MLAPPEQPPSMCALVGRALQGLKLVSWQPCHGKPPPQIQGSATLCPKKCSVAVPRTLAIVAVICRLCKPHYSGVASAGPLIKPAHGVSAGAHRPSRTAGSTGAPLLAATQRLAPSISTLPLLQYICTALLPAVWRHPCDHAGTHAAQQTKQCNRPESRLEGDGCSGDAAVHDDLRRGTQGTPSQDKQDCSRQHTYLESGKT